MQDATAPPDEASSESEAAARQRWRQQQALAVATAQASDSSQPPISNSGAGHPPDARDIAGSAASSPSGEGLHAYWHTQQVIGLCPFSLSSWTGICTYCMSMSSQSDSGYSGAELGSGGDLDL